MSKENLNIDIKQNEMTAVEGQKSCVITFMEHVHMAEIQVHLELCNQYNSSLYNLYKTIMECDFTKNQLPLLRILSFVQQSKHFE